MKGWNEWTSDWAAYTVGDLRLEHWLSFALLSVGIWVLLIYLKRKLLVRGRVLVERTATHIDDVILKCLASTRLAFLLVLSIAIAAEPFAFSAAALSLVKKVGIVALFIQAALWGNVWLSYGLERYFSHKNHDMKGENVLASYTAILITAKFVLWSVAVLLLLDNLGVNITALVTGLGIGGIAIALAVQNILGDIFASLTIILDKPFEAGDFIIVDKMQGTVESVGLKTTRIRSLSGEQWIFPNKQLIESRVQNYKRMNQRRIQFGFGVAYGTGHEELAAIPALVRGIIEGQSTARLDRVHFKAFGESSLDFEVVYFMLKPDYNLYMDTQQAINLAMLRIFQEHGIELAFPTRTVILQAGDARPLLPRNEDLMPSRSDHAAN